MDAPLLIWVAVGLIPILGLSGKKITAAPITDVQRIRRLGSGPSRGVPYLQSYDAYDRLRHFPLHQLPKENL